MKPARSSRYRRVLLKLSGEVLAGEREGGIDYEAINAIADQLVEVHKVVELAVVIGGGNIFRGLEASRHGVERVTADYAGMLGTIINSLVLQSALETRGVQTRVQTAFEVRSIAEPYIRRRAIRHLEKGRVVIFSGGTGRPYFSTDTAAALCATEIKADVLLKATKVDGIFTADPEHHKDAEFIHEITYQEILERDLRVMDATAVSMSKENRIPIIVFNINRPGNLLRVVRGENVGTRVMG